MKKHTLALALATLITSVSAIAEQPPQGMPDAFTHPGVAAEARVGVHRLMAINLMDAGALAMGQKEWNGFRMQDRADALEALSRMSYEFFLVPGSHEGTAAKASILDNPEHYKKLNTRLETATRGVAHAVRNHDGPSAFKGMVKTIQTCNACHQQYMEPALILPIPQPPQAAH